MPKRTPRTAPPGDGRAVPASSSRIAASSAAQDFMTTQRYMHLTPVLAKSDEIACVRWVGRCPFRMRRPAAHATL